MTTHQKLRALVQTVKPFSKLFISPRYAQTVYKVVEPDLRLSDYLNDDYLERVKRSLSLRTDEDKPSRNGLAKINFEQFKRDLRELLSQKEQLKAKLKESKESKESADVSEQLREDKSRIQDLEEQVIPIALRLPNLFNEEEVPVDGFDDRVLKQTEIKRFDFKLLDGRRIAYIQELRKSSILGPHCEYLLGKGALIHLALQKHFRQSIETAFPEPAARIVHRHLHEVDGLDLVKSALVEAANDYEELDYRTDARIVEQKEHEDQQHLHLVGSCSKESLLSLLIKKKLNAKFLPARFVQFGCTYDQSLRQKNTICLFTIVPNDFSVSDGELKRMERLLCDMYEQLGLPIRLRRVNLKRLHFNEYNRVELDVYLPYSREWRLIAHFSHYGDHLTRRMHSANHHCLAGNLTDYSLLLDAILENHQTETGRLVVPDCLQALL